MHGVGGEVDMVTRTEQRLKAGDDLIVWSEEAGPYNSEPEELLKKVRRPAVAQPVYTVCLHFSVWHEV